MRQTGVPGTVKMALPREVLLDDSFVTYHGEESFVSDVYELGDCTVIVGREGDPLLWHLSISHPGRYPTWDEIKVARYRLLPDEVMMALLLPPSGEYVNVPEQDNVFHLWEVAGL